MFCTNCGAQIDDHAAVCIKCGHAVVHNPNIQQTFDPNKSSKDWLTTLILCFFLGSLGIHSFYAGKTGIGIVQLLTCGGCGIWTLIDFVMIVMGNYTDAEGKAIKNN